MAAEAATPRARATATLRLDFTRRARQACRMIRSSLLVAALVACGGKPAPTPVTPAPAPVVAADPTPAPEPTPAPLPPKVDPAKEQADLLAAETAAYEKAKPAFTKYCAGCHTKAGKKADKKKLAHFGMDAYPFTGEHAKSIGNEIRVVLAIDGHKKATMPSDKPGAVTGDDLAAIKAWSEAWQAAGKAGVHPAEPADKDDD